MKATTLHMVDFSENGVLSCWKFWPGLYMLKESKVSHFAANVSCATWLPTRVFQGTGLLSTEKKDLDSLLQLTGNQEHLRTVPTQTFRAPMMVSIDIEFLQRFVQRIVCRLRQAFLNLVGLFDDVRLFRNQECAVQVLARLIEL